MDHVADNPFFVLELPATATAMEVERQGKMLLARLELGLPSAQHHPSPLGRRPRTADDVRRAVQALSDPRRRLAAEPFALGMGDTPVDVANAAWPGEPDAVVDGAGQAVADSAVAGSLPWWRP